MAVSLFFSLPSRHVERSGVHGKGKQERLVCLNFFFEARLSKGNKAWKQALGLFFFFWLCFLKSMGSSTV